MRTEARRAHCGDPRLLPLASRGRGITLHVTLLRPILGEGHSGRRKVLAVALLLLFALVVRLIWGVWSERRAREAIAALRARGEAVEAAEVVYPDVPDAENAWDQAIDMNAVIREQLTNLRNEGLDDKTIYALIDHYNAV